MNHLHSHALALVTVDNTYNSAARFPHLQKGKANINHPVVQA